MDLKKWKRIKRSGGFRRKVTKNYQLLLLNTATIPTFNLEETVPSQEESDKNKSGSLHFSTSTTFNAVNAGFSQDNNQNGSAHPLLPEGILDSES